MTQIAHWLVFQLFMQRIFSKIVVSSVSTNIHFSVWYTGRAACNEMESYKEWRLRQRLASISIWAFPWVLGGWAGWAGHRAFLSPVQDEAARWTRDRGQSEATPGSGHSAGMWERPPASSMISSRFLKSKSTADSAPATTDIRKGQWEQISS